MKKSLASCNGHEIVAQFLDENEYNTYCRKVMSASLDIALKSLSLDEIIDLWQKKNGDCTDDEIAAIGSVRAVKAVGQ